MLVLPTWAIDLCENKTCHTNMVYNRAFWDDDFLLLCILNKFNSNSYIVEGKLNSKK